MSILKIFKKKSSPQKEKNQGRGFLIFANTSEVIRAETILKDRGFDIRVMGPPSEIRTGCDMVIEFPIIAAMDIQRMLTDARTPPLQIVPVSSPLLRPVDLFHIKDFGRYLMVRAANMKLTFDKETLTIVNISGGGCPDVPYLAKEIIGKTLKDAVSPRDIGHTLCGYALQLAYEEACRRC
ncbi:MAG: hypothetical protein DDT18_01908 [Actinobacteria bacterium]|nr:hypothetical protein [Actinomycetota bacterium]